ncbi:unnamed protein product [Haemonchus placei]|uniref:Similar to n=1 Tax=Haemonchus placei TaxID=6290 RepID=A0A0N4VUK6_HAEPC|nr:unnamed protein product [Haemonchus placei]
MDREERRKAIEKQAQEAGESDTAQRENERPAASPPPIQRLGKDHMQMFPSTSSEPSLANKEQSDRDGNGKAPAAPETKAEKPGVTVTAPQAIRDPTAVRTTSKDSTSDDEEGSPPRPAAPADYEI